MTRPRVILLHGWTMRGSVFDGLVDRLREVADCVAPDLPGHGASAGLPPTLDAAAQLLSDVITEDNRRPVVVGWSMGAAVAWRYVARNGSDALAGLMTVDMSPRISPGSDWPYGLRGQTEAGLAETTDRMKTDWTGSAHAIAATMFAKGNDPKPFGRAEALAQILSEDPQKMRNAWADLVDSDARSTVARVICPWLITYGARSNVYGEDVAQWLQSHAPDARLHRFEHSGHSPHLEEPAAFAETLAAFVKGG